MNDGLNEYSTHHSLFIFESRHNLKSGVGELFVILKYLVIAFVEFIVTEMGVSLRDLDVAVTCKLLCKFEVA